MEVEITYGPVPGAMALGIRSVYRDPVTGAWCSLSNWVDGLDLSVAHDTGDGWSIFDLIQFALKQRSIAARMLAALPLGLYFEPMPGLH